MPTPRSVRQLIPTHQSMTTSTDAALTPDERDQVNGSTLRRFGHWYADGGAESETVAHRELFLRRLGVWLSDEHQTTLADATEDQLIAFRRTLDWSAHLDRHTSDATRSLYVGIMRLFYGAFLLDYEMYRPDDPSRRIRRPRRRRRDEDDLRDIPERLVWVALQAARDEPEMLAWLMLARYGSARCVEIARLRVDDCEDADDDSGMVWVTLTGKGGTRRRNPMVSEIRIALAPFRSGSGRAPLFTHPSGRPYHRQQVSRRINEFLDRCGLGEYTAHQLRHSCASRLLEATDNLRKVQVYLGHSSPESTAIYTHIRKRDLADVVELDARRTLRRRRRPSCHGGGP